MGSNKNFSSVDYLPVKEFYLYKVFTPRVLLPATLAGLAGLIGIVTVTSMVMSLRVSDFSEWTNCPDVDRGNTHLKVWEDPEFQPCDNMWKSKKWRYLARSVAREGLIYWLVGLGSFFPFWILGYLAGFRKLGLIVILLSLALFGTCARNIYLYVTL